MADQTPINGQFIPLARQNDLARTPSSYSITPRVGETNAYKGESFYDVLNRTQLTSSQLKSMQAPQSAFPSASSTTPSINTGAITPMTESPTPSLTFTPSPGAPYNQQLMQETNDHLKNAPLAAPQGESVDNLIQKNMEEYAAQKAAAQASPDNSPKTIEIPEPTPEPAQAANTPANTSSPISASPAQTNDEIVISPEDAKALQAALTRSVVNSQPVDSKAAAPAGNQLESLPVHITDEPVLDPIPEPASVAGFPAYIPAARLTKSASAATTSAGETNPAGNIQEETTASSKSSANKSAKSTQAYSKNVTASNSKANKTTESEESAEDDSTQKTFPHAVGNFFGSIASAVTLGFYRPEGDPTPTGFARVVDPIKKVVWDAPKSILIDAPAGAFHGSSKTAKGEDSESQSIALSNKSANESRPRTIRNFGPSRNSLRRNFYT